MAGTDEVEPSYIQRYEAQPDTRHDSITTNVNQPISTASSENEKAMHGEKSSPSESSEVTLSPPDEEPQRSRGKVVLLMGALCVCGRTPLS